MTQELTEIEFKSTFGNGMTDITHMEIDEPIDIWSYVKELVDNQIIAPLVHEKELVEKVYRNDLKTYDHIILPVSSQNIVIALIVDLKSKSVFGHKLLNLNTMYGN